MRPITLLLFLAVGIARLSAQNPYIEEFDSHKWMSVTQLSESKLKTDKKMSLVKMVKPKDSLTTNVDILEFGNGKLTIRRYDASTKHDSLVLTCKYEVNINKNLLTLTLDDGSKQKFEVIIMGGMIASLKRKE